MYDYLDYLDAILNLKLLYRIHFKNKRLESKRLINIKKYEFIKYIYEVVSG